MARRRKRDSDERPASPKGKRPGQRSLLRRILILLSIPVFLVLAAAGTLIGIFYYYGSDPNLPNLKNLGQYHPDQVVKVLDRDGNLLHSDVFTSHYQPWGAVIQVAPGASGT
jgi:hypothetical protein